MLQPNPINLKDLYAGSKYQEKIQSVHFEITTETQYRNMQIRFAGKVTAV
jgi:hypothetical protein